MQGYTYQLLCFSTEPEITTHRHMVTKLLISSKQNLELVLRILSLKKHNCDYEIRKALNFYEVSGDEKIVSGDIFNIFFLFLTLYLIVQIITSAQL